MGLVAVDSAIRGYDPSSDLCCHFARTGSTVADSPVSPGKRSFTWMRIVTETLDPKSGSWLIADPARIGGIYRDANKNPSSFGSPIG
jgi:hypothetical protein